MKQSRNLPSKKKIAEYWSEVFFRHGWELDQLSGDSCFACCRIPMKIQRCHIKARCDGGSDQLQNIHLLCPGCHDESEPLSGLTYWRWYKHKRFSEANQILQMDIARFEATHGAILATAKEKWDQGCRDKRELLNLPKSKRC